MLIQITVAIEDDELRRELKRRLNQLDVLVHVPTDVKGSWQRMLRRPSELIVIDSRMLPSGPLEAMRIVSQLPEPPTTILITEELSAEDRARLQAAGCSATLEKHLPPEVMVSVMETLIEQHRAALEDRLVRHRIQKEPDLSDFACGSTTMRAFIETVQRVVHTEVSLLLMGETGVGKERLARAIHYASRRVEGPFVAINCGALPETLLESELFGHEKGAFTGAVQQRRGCFELAHGGTLFLDEIGELPYHLQVKLLRVLQEREVQRLGSEKPVPIDARFMAATNRDLEAEVDNGRFRQDLYYRLNVVALTIPPLRERPEDIPVLAQQYVDYFRPRFDSEVLGLSAESRDAFTRYSWPGNIRELVNVIERAMILARGDELLLTDLPTNIASLVEHASVPRKLLEPHSDDTGRPHPSDVESWLDRPWREIRHEILERAERSYLEALLTHCGGRIGETARRAGIQTRSLFDKLKYHGLKKEDFRATKAQSPSGDFAEVDETEVDENRSL